MVRIAVCDSVEGVQHLKKILEGYVARDIIKAQMDFYCSEEDILEAYIEKKIGYDILVIDENMAFNEVFRVAKEIRKRDHVCKMILLSSCPENARKGFAVHAYSYLLRPITTEAFLIPIKDAIEELEKPMKRMIMLKTLNGIFRIPVADIIYIESNLRVLHIHTRRNGVLQKYEKLSVLEESLPREVFLRCHRSWLVNMGYVQEIRDHRFILFTGQEIPIKSNGSAAVKARFFAFVETIGDVIV